MHGQSCRRLRFYLVLEDIRFLHICKSIWPEFNRPGMSMVGREMKQFFFTASSPVDWPGHRSVIHLFISKLNTSTKSTINDQIRPADETRLLTSQEYHRISNFLSISHPPHRVQCQLPLELLRFGFLNTTPNTIRNINIPWRHCIGPHSLGCESPCKARNVMNERRLHRAVWTGSGMVNVSSADGVDGNDIPFAHFQLWQRSLYEDDGRQDVHSVGLIPLLYIISQRQRRHICNYNINFGADRYALLYPTFHSIPISDIKYAAMGLCLWILFAEVCLCFYYFVGSSRAEMYCAAFGEEAFDNAASDAFCAS